MIETRHFLASAYKHYDWSFLPPMFSGTMGITIGLVIASALGWV